MTNIATRATDGVKIPGRKQTRQEIIDMFKARLTDLHNRLNVSISYSELSLVFYVAFPRVNMLKGWLV
jgi:hypothetical protein